MPEPTVETQKHQETELIFPEHYLDRSDIRELVKIHWPDLLSKIPKATKPQISNNPDDLEVWETKMRISRINYLNQLSSLDALQRLLYEECFGVNATPGQNESYRASCAPTPGGMVSHGYSHIIRDGMSTESAALLDFSGTTAIEAVSSIEDFSQKIAFASIIAQSLYPVESKSDYLTQTKNKQITEVLCGKRGLLTEEVDTWGIRMLKLIKVAHLYSEVQNPKTKAELGHLVDSKGSIAYHWSRLWKKMAPIYTQEGNYTQADSDRMIQAIGTLLKLRLDPEFQILFKYYSPSGYINEIASNH